MRLCAILTYCGIVLMVAFFPAFGWALRSRSRVSWALLAVLVALLVVVLAIRLRRVCVVEENRPVPVIDVSTTPLAPDSRTWTKISMPDATRDGGPDSGPTTFALAGGGTEVYLTAWRVIPEPHGRVFHCPGGVDLIGPVHAEPVDICALSPVPILVIPAGVQAIPAGAKP